jgi:hypothetical protein
MLLLVVSGQTFAFRAQVHACTKVFARAGENEYPNVVSLG